MITTATAGSAVTLADLQQFPSNTLSKFGAGTADVNNLRGSAALVVEGTLKILPNGSDSGTSKLDTLAIAGDADAWEARLDITDNKVIANYSGGSPLAIVQNQIRSGYAGGSWTGNGITSSAAAAVAIDGAQTHKTGLGFADASALGLTSFGGLSIDGPAILVRYTLYGDGNLDGAVDSVDFNLLASSFGESGKSWGEGDYNYDGLVDTLDFNALAANFSQTLPAPPPQGAFALVPEPASIALVLLSALTSLKRFRRCVHVRTLPDSFSPPR